MSSGWIVVEGWDEFQHVDVKRGSGPPPWIKNYTRLLNDDDYLSLSPVRRCLLHGIWLAYAQTRASLNADTRKLCYRLNLRVRQSDIEALVHAGFITLSASKPLAGRLRDAGTTRARVEVEEEVEVEPAEQSRSKTSEARESETRHEASGNGLAGNEESDLERVAPLDELDAIRERLESRGVA